MADDERRTTPGGTVIDDGPAWVWPTLVAVTALLFVGQTLTAADNGWPLGSTLMAVATAALVVLAGLGWHRSRRRRD